MTLVVARQVNDEVYIVGDTKFTVHENMGSSESRTYVGGLKVVLLSPGLCVSFAGNIEIARDAIQGVYDKDINLYDKNLTIDHFLEHHIRSTKLEAENVTDFIVAVIVESNESAGKFVKEIFRISDSKVYWENETARIGDLDAFNYFQEAFHNGGRGPNLPRLEISKLGVTARPGFDQSLSSAMSAMQCVIDNPKMLRVDGIRTVVISEEGQFKYLKYLQIQGNPIPVTTEPYGPVTFGGAQEGSDHKHVGMFAAHGLGIFPVYNYPGRFGLIYHPEIDFEPTTYRNCELEEFRLKVQEVISSAHQRALKYQMRF